MSWVTPLKIILALCWSVMVGFYFLPRLETWGIFTENVIKDQGVARQCRGCQDSVKLCIIYSPDPRQGQTFPEYRDGQLATTGNYQS